MNTLILKPFYTIRGGAKLKFIVTLVIVIGITYVIIQAAPVWIDHYGLKDEAQQLALNNPCRSADKIKEELLRRIKSLPNTVVRDDQVTVRCDGDIMKIRAAYRRRLELPGYSRTFSFDIDTGVRKF